MDDVQPVHAIMAKDIVGQFVVANIECREFVAVFSYYSNLSKADKAVYRASDRAAIIRLGNPAVARKLVAHIEKALLEEDRRQVLGYSRELLRLLAGDLQVVPVTVQVYAARPSHDWGELHGLYEPGEGKRRARVSVWMRTARHRRVVAFRTFLRTLLHEFCHHLDYELLDLPDSFHTEGFFRRESVLFRQLVPD